MQMKKRNRYSQLALLFSLRLVVAIECHSVLNIIIYSRTAPALHSIQINNNSVRINKVRKTSCEANNFDFKNFLFYFLNRISIRDYERNIKWQEPACLYNNMQPQCTSTIALLHAIV